ncbi:MAG: hypothetical protein OHK0056_20610 [Bacteriovoracaceae bacterium]
MANIRREQIQTMEFWQMVSATLVGLIVYSTSEDPSWFWGHSFFLGSFILLRWFRFREEFALQFIDDREELFHHLWLLDAFLLALAAVETHTINLLFFAAIDVTFSPLIKDFNEEIHSKKKNLSRAMATTLSFGALSFFWGKSGVELSSLREGLILLAGLGTLWINIQMLEEKHTDHATKSSLAVTERLFFHDLINHTHSILLALEAKQKEQELSEMKQEILKLQMLVQDHYKYHHKNLNGLKLFFRVSELEVEARKIFENYMPAPEWKLHWHSDLSFDGHLGAAQFIRIVTNIAKNMAESHSLEAEVFFHSSPDRLVIKTKNRISKEYRNDPSSPWNHHALSDCFRDLGSGLKSVHKQCVAIKGQFQFAVEGEYWVNKVSLPIETREYTKLDKKAA